MRILIPILTNKSTFEAQILILMSEVTNAKRAFGVDLAMNCATTNAFFINEKLLFRNGTKYR